MKTIRVALMPMRPRLRDILTTAITSEADMELTRCPTGRLEQIAAIQPDVVVGETADLLDPLLATDILEALPRSRVLLVAESGLQAAVYELRPTRTIVRDLGMAEVLAAIRFGVGLSVPGPGPDVQLRP